MRNQKWAHLRHVSWLVVGFVVALVGPVPAQPPAAGPRGAIEVRTSIFAPWALGQMGALRRKLGLVGPGPSGPLPKPAFPSYLKTPRSVDELLPAARAAVRQTGGRVPLGLVERGEIAAMFVPYRSEPLVQEAIKRAFAERGVEAQILFENELVGVKKEDLEAIRKAENVFDASDGQQEPAEWFFRTIPDDERARQWVRQRDPQLYRATWPAIKYPNAALARLAEEYGDRIAPAVIRYLDQHPEVKKVFWRQGGRGNTQRALRHHGPKFIGNYTYLDFYDIVSRVPSFPPDVWRLVELKTIEPLGEVDRAEVMDVEGSAFAFDLTAEEARRWAKGVYQQGHLYMFPSQASGSWPYSLVNYPARTPEYVPPVQIEVNGIIAGTNNHVATHPRMEVHVRNGKIAEIKGGGLYGELWRLLLNYPGTQDLTWPLFQKPGYWWLYEAGTGTNPKYFKHPAEILEGRNSSERNVAGVIHWSFGVEAEGPEQPTGDFSPRTIEFGIRHNVPIRHCCHNHNLMPTYQVRIRGTGRWETLINFGRMTALDDPEVRALAARYGNPDEILRQDYIPAIPGITIAGNYNEYARNPGAYWVKWAKSILEGNYKYFKP